MIKSEIISYVKGQTPREDKNQRFHNRYLEAVIEGVIKEMYSDLYKINPGLLDLYTKTYGNVTPVAVSLERTTGIYYSTLPVNIINLPCKSSGVRQIYPLTKSTGNIFQPMDATEADLIFNTDVAVVTNKVGYRVKQNSRVDYYNMNASIISSGVIMDLLIPFSVYADTDVVLIPELTEKEGGTFIDRVMKVLGLVPPADLQDDNAAPKAQPKK